VIGNSSRTAAGKVLYESGDVLRHVYSPINSIVSLLYVLADGASAEISVVGLIANMLGVRREGVTAAAGKLHKLGVIRYARGQITVLDRPKLEQLCCECYAVVKKETDRLLPRAHGSRTFRPKVAATDHGNGSQDFMLIE
jgi:hypothetical protein